MIEISETNNVVEIKFLDDKPLSWNLLPDTENTLIETILSRTHPTVFCLNLKDVHYLTSPAIRMLLEIRQLAHSHQHRIRLCNVTGHVLEVLQITRLDHVFELEMSYG